MKKIFFILLFLFSVLISQAQTSDLGSLIRQAENAYSIGKFDEALIILEDSLKNAVPPLSAEVYRLSGLCYLALDNHERAVYYAKLLLKEKPYYSDIKDTQRFTDMIKQLKSETENSVSSASFQSETLDEVPVPVTVITRQMIQDCGAQTLQDVLIAYVPGVTNIQYNGLMNFAMRGLFGETQENVLIMLDGMRLNSYAFNTGLADYSVSLEKIKQIEVLRGPGSSLYGDVALSAVVNIVTRKGSDIDGTELSAGIGNFGQKKADIVFGKRYGGLDINAWGSIYRADGEKADFSSVNKYLDNDTLGTYTIGCYNQTPAYDFGVGLSWKNFNFTFRHSASKSGHNFAESIGTLYPYKYDRYSRIDGVSPGDYISNGSAELSYSRKIGRFSVYGAARYFQEHTVRYQVNYDTLEYGFESPYFESVDVDYDDFDIDNFEFLFLEKYYCSGIGKYTQWRDYNCGLSLRSMYEYGTENSGGTILLGADINKLNATDFYEASVFNYGEQSFDEPKVQDYSEEFVPNKKRFIGNEKSNNAYLQLKHRYRRFILNSGIRYDYREHTTDTVGTEIKTLSPRLSLIYMMERLNFKVGYSRSFVDLPYSKRKRFEWSFSDMDPETLSSLQVTVSGRDFVDNLHTEVNFYYNKCKSLFNVLLEGYDIQYDIASYGAEFSASYAKSGFNINVVCNIQKSESESDSFTDDDVNTYYMQYAYMQYAYRGNVFNVPSFNANATAAYQVCEILRLSLNCRFSGSQYTKYTKWTDDIYYFVDKFPAVAVFSPRADFSYKNFGLSLVVNNVFNKKYLQGGSSVIPVCQKGRWLMLTAKYRF